jgi:hypothetical protein
MKRADAERSHRHAPYAFRIQGLLRPGRLSAVDEPAREEQQHVIRSEPAERERKRARRRLVGPLDVVDGNHERLPFAELLQHVAYRHGKRAMIHRIA